MASLSRRFGPVRPVVLGLAVLAAGGFGATAAHAAAPQLFAERWIDGTNGAEPATQVQALDGDTFVIRQSVKTIGANVFS